MKRQLSNIRLPIHAYAHTYNLHIYFYYNKFTFYSHIDYVNCKVDFRKIALE